MCFLVTMEHIHTGETPPLSELDAFLDNARRMVKGGKAKGGILTGRRGAAFILHVDSHEQLSDVLCSMPIWA